MNWTNLPPLNTLKAFTALANEGSYSKAGKALNVTHAAVLQQVRALEKYLAVSLVVRSGRGVRLTEDGKVLANDLAVGFARLQSGIESVQGTSAFRPVQVTTSPAFAVKWLMPRIADFQMRYPDVTLLINPTGQMMELKPGGIDLAIRYCRFEDLPKAPEALVHVDLAVVGVPMLKNNHKNSGPSDLQHFPWLQELGTTEVTDWFARHDVALDRPLMISHMPGNLIMDAVKRGDGITYTAKQWVETELQTKKLIEYWPEADKGAFYIQHRPGELRRPVSIFLRWLMQQATAES